MIINVAPQASLPPQTPPPRRRGLRWVLVIVRADTGGCPYGWLQGHRLACSHASAISPPPLIPASSTSRPTASSCSVAAATAIRFRCSVATRKPVRSPTPARTSPSVGPSVCSSCKSKAKWVHQIEGDDIGDGTRTSERGRTSSNSRIGSPVAVRPLWGREHMSESRSPRVKTRGYAHETPLGSYCRVSLCHLIYYSKIGLWVE